MVDHVVAHRSCVGFDVDVLAIADRVVSA